MALPRKVLPIEFTHHMHIVAHRYKVYNTIMIVEAQDIDRGTSEIWAGETNARVHCTHLELFVLEVRQNQRDAATDAHTLKQRHHVVLSST